jgi:hypothetical protein
VARISNFTGLAPALARLDDLYQRAVALGAASAQDLQGLRAFLALEAEHSCDLGPLEAAAEAMAATPRVVEPWGPWNPAACFVLATSWLEDFEAGERHYRSLAERAGDEEPVVSDTALAFAYADGLVRQGRLDEAEAVVAGATHAGDVVFEGAGIDLRARTLLALEAGRCEEAVALASSNQAAGDASGRWLLSCWGDHTKGRVLLALGKAEEAADTYRSLAEKASAAGLRHPCVLPWAGAALTAFHRSGAHDEVAAVVGWPEETSADSPCRWPRAMAAVGRGLLAGDAGDHAGCDQAFEEALGLLRQVCLPLELGQVALAYATVLRRRGQRKRPERW